MVTIGIFKKLRLLEVSLRKNLVEGERQSWKEWRRDRRLGLFGREFLGGIETAFAELKDFHRLGVGINNPIFLNLCPFIEGMFNPLVIFPGTVGQNFHNQIRSALNISFGDDGGSGGRDEEKIWLDDVHLGKEDINRSKEDSSQRALMDEWPYEPMERGHNALMLGKRCGRDVMVSINKFMPFPVLGKR
jgi:hypothetical protein